MALSNPETGEYLRIESVNFDRDYVCTVNYKVYASLAHRTNGDTPYMQSRFGSVNSGILQQYLNALPDPLFSIMENVIKAGYKAIKADTFDFSIWLDA